MRIGICTCLLLFLSLPAQAEAPQRIITIGGAITEIVYALDMQSRIIGSDTTSYYPEAAKQLPKVGYQRTLSAEGILSLNPDLVILTEEAGPPFVLEQLKSARLGILKLKTALSLQDIKQSIAKIGRALGAEKKARALIAKLDRESKELARLKKRYGARKRVLFILNHGGGPAMVAGKGTKADRIIALSGAQNAITGYHGYKPLTPEAAISLKPDIILITSQGLAQAGGRENLLKKPGLSLTPAARQGNIIAMDALLMLGFGPRIVEAALALNKAYRAL